MKVRFMMMLFASVTLAATACSKKEESAKPATAPSVTENPAPAQPATPAPPGTPEAKLDDAQIAAIVVAANQVDIDAGQLAVTKAKNPEVKKFAQQMITDHTAVNKSAVELVTKLKVTPVESDASKGLTTGGNEARAKLEKLEGDEFDRAYVDNEVAYHEAVIDVLKTQLIPSATNTELKTALEGVLPAFDAHLLHAKQIQATLAGGAANK